MTDLQAAPVVQDQWYPDLKSTVKKIDTTFQRNFKDIGCAGEVSLAEHADYDKFSIQIKYVSRALLEQATQHCLICSKHALPMSASIKCDLAILFCPTFRCV